MVPQRAGFCQTEEFRVVLNPVGLTDKRIIRQSFQSYRQQPIDCPASVLFPTAAMTSTEWILNNVPGVFRVKCQWCKNRHLFSSPQGSRNPTDPFHQPHWNTRSAPSLLHLQIIRGHCEGKVTAIAEYLISIRLRKIKWMLMRSAIQNMHYASWDRNQGGFSHVFIK